MLTTSKCQIKYRQTINNRGVQIRGPSRIWHFGARSEFLILFYIDHLHLNGFDTSFLLVLALATTKTLTDGRRGAVKKFARFWRDSERLIVEFNLRSDMEVIFYLFSFPELFMCRIQKR